MSRLSPSAASQAAESPRSDSNPEALPRDGMSERGEFEVTFKGSADFAALREAEDWLKARGFSHGPMQGGEFIGVMHGDVVIGKWRTLDSEEQNDLHGFLMAQGGSYRTGDVILIMRRNGPATVMDAFRSDPAASPATQPDADYDLAAREHIEGRQVAPISGWVGG